jgi:tetratricopeptide (TPR) repeat protein
MQDAISEKIAAAMVAQLSGVERQALRKHGTENREAYEQYLRGRYFWNKVWSGQVRKSIESFNQAIAIDPNYALAYAGLADAYWGMIIGQSNALEMMPRAKAAATRALELDSTLAEAHVAMANVRAFYDWNWPEADREFRLALALKPGLVETHLWYNQYLSAMGRFQEAMTEIEQARRLDPLSLQINLRLGDTFYCSGQYDAALAQYRKTLELDSHFPIAHYRIGLIHTLRGRYEEAIAEFEKEMASSGMRASVNLAGIARACALAGRRDEALKFLDEAKTPTEQRRYVMPWAIAVAYAALGDRDQAFAWMEKAYEERPLRLVFLKVDPVFDGLRADPRFARLLRRVGFEP